MNRGVLVGVGLAVLLVAGLGGIYAFQRHTKASAREALTGATTRLSDCLVGDAPGGVGGALDQELLASRAAFEPDDSDAGWPKRCRTYAEPIGQAIRRARGAGVVSADVPLDDAIALLRAGKLVHEGSGTPDVANVLVALEAFRHGAHDPTVPPPPPAARPLVSEARPIGGKDDAMFVSVTQQTSRGARFALAADPAISSSRVSCEYDAIKKKLLCKRAFAGFGGFVEGDIGSPIVFQTDGTPGGGIVDENAVKLVEIGTGSTVSHARSLADGRIAAITVGDETSALVRSAGGQVVTTRFDDRVNAGGERVAGAFVVWKERPADDAVFSLRGSSTATTEPPAALLAGSFADPASPTVTIGNVGRRPPTAERTDGTCEADALFFDMSPALVVRDAKGAWHVLDQEPLAVVPPSRRTMSCGGERLDMLDTSDSSVKRQRCTPQGCKSETVAVKLPAGATIVPAGDRVLVAWHGPGTNAIYFARSTLADLPHATPRPLLDSKPATDVDLAPELAAFGNEVLVLLRGAVATYAIVIHDDDTATSLTTSY